LSLNEKTLPIIICIIFDFNDEETVDEETETGPSVNLWGVDYSIENTTELDLSDNQLTGIIPETICELTNLNWSPVNLWGVDYSYLYNNQLCPPYPSCIEFEDDVGEQDTSDCD